MGDGRLGGRAGLGCRGDRSLRSRAQPGDQAAAGTCGGGAGRRARRRGPGRNPDPVQGRPAGAAGRRTALRGDARGAGGVAPPDLPFARPDKRPARRLRGLLEHVVRRARGRPRRGRRGSQHLLVPPDPRRPHARWRTARGRVYRDPRGRGQHGRPDRDGVRGRRHGLRRDAPVPADPAGARPRTGTRAALRARSGDGGALAWAPACPAPGRIRRRRLPGVRHRRRRDARLRVLPQGGVARPRPHGDRDSRPGREPSRGGRRGGGGGCDEPERGLPARALRDRRPVGVELRAVPVRSTRSAPGGVPGPGGGGGQGAGDVRAPAGAGGGAGGRREGGPVPGRGDRGRLGR